MSNVKIVIITVLKLCLTENTRCVVLCRQVIALYCQSLTNLQSTPFGGGGSQSVHNKAGLACSNSLCSKCLMWNDFVNIYLFSDIY
jgi:hypothetical protein